MMLLRGLESPSQGAPSKLNFHIAVKILKGAPKKYASADKKKKKRNTPLLIKKKKLLWSPKTHHH